MRLPQRGPDRHARDEMALGNSENSTSCRQLRPQHSASELLARLYRSFRGDGCPHALAQVPACALLDLRCYQNFALSPHSLQAWLALAGRKTKSNSSAATPTSAPRSVLGKLLRPARHPVCDRDYGACESKRLGAFWPI